MVILMLKYHLQQMFQGIKDVVAWGLIILILMAGYLAFGFALAIPYGLWSGWYSEPDSLPMMVLVLPVAALGLFILWQGAWFERRNFRGQNIWRDIFLTYVAWLNLPCFFNLLSLAVGWAGFPKTANFIHALRFSSLLLVPIALLLALFILGILIGFAQQVRTLFRKPSSPAPPSSPANPPQVANTESISDSDENSNFTWQLFLSPSP